MDDMLIFATLDDTLRHLEKTAEASRKASDRIERLTIVLIVLTLVLAILTSLLVAEAFGFVR